MKHLVIIGAGGMGRTFYSNALESVGYGNEFVIKGFINDYPSLGNFQNYPAIIGTIEDYEPMEDDVFICSIGDKLRKNCIEKIRAKGGKFINLIHQTARLYTNVEIGVGNFIGAYTVIGNDAKIGDFNMIQSYTVIGHDDIIGDWNRIDTHVTCVGGIVIENHVDIHTVAVIGHHVVVESEANVGACSFVIRRVKSGTTVFGNPARKLI